MRRCSQDMIFVSLDHDKLVRLTSIRFTDLEQDHLGLDQSVSTLACFLLYYQLLASTTHHNMKLFENCLTIAFLLSLPILSFNGIEVSLWLQDGVGYFQLNIGSAKLQSYEGVDLHVEGIRYSHAILTCIGRVYSYDLSVSQLFSQRTS